MAVISESGIVLESLAKTPEQAILECGNLLMALGAVTPEYLASMFEREQSITSAIGEGLAIPHGTESGRDYVNFDQLVLLQLKNPIQWGSQEVHLVIGIASKHNSHVNLLAKIAGLAVNDGLERIRTAKTKTEILELLVGTEQ